MFVLTQTFSFCFRRSEGHDQGFGTSLFLFCSGLPSLIRQRGLRHSLLDLEFKPISHSICARNHSTCSSSQRSSREVKDNSRHPLCYSSYWTTQEQIMFAPLQHPVQVQSPRQKRKPFELINSIFRYVLYSNFWSSSTYFTVKKLERADRVIQNQCLGSEWVPRAPLVVPPTTSLQIHQSLPEFTTSNRTWMSLLCLAKITLTFSAN